MPDTDHHRTTVTRADLAHNPRSTTMRRLARLRAMSPRVISPALIGLGAFLVVAGVLVRLYAYPALAAVPTNYDSFTTLEATDATIFNTDPEVLAPETTDLAITSHTVAGHYPDAPEGVVVWANSVTVRT
ncbi:MAG: DUF3068 domain-containing protein, partial [Actinobacteria bacterium]|nr:DUF3068 domain-containing protein [Actinomycetota bacterium]